MLLASQTKQWQYRVQQLTVFIAAFLFSLVYHTMNSISEELGNDADARHRRVAANPAQSRNPAQPKKTPALPLPFALFPPAPTITLANNSIATKTKTSTTTMSAADNYDDEAPPPGSSPPAEAEAGSGDPSATAPAADAPWATRHRTKLLAGAALVVVVLAVALGVAFGTGGGGGDGGAAPAPAIPAPEIATEIATVPISGAEVDVALPPALEAKVPDFADELTAEEAADWALVEASIASVVRGALSAALPEGYEVAPVEVTEFDGHSTSDLRRRHLGKDSRRILQADLAGATHAVVYDSSVDVDCQISDCALATGAVAGATDALAGVEALAVPEEPAASPAASTPAPAAPPPTTVAPPTAGPPKAQVRLRTSDMKSRISRCDAHMMCSLFDNLFCCSR